MIRVPDENDARHEMWRELISLNDDPPAPWTLIGAHMVVLHGWKLGRSHIRPSLDADILTDPRAVTDATSRWARHLDHGGYALEGQSADGIGHRFVRGAVRIDLLAPDGMGSRARLHTLGRARTVRVPGGSQALHRTVPMRIAARRTEGTIPIPDLLGAILLKSRAVLVDDEPAAQRLDLAFLLSLVDDPAQLGILSAAERRWLRRLPEFADPAEAVWRDIPKRENGALVFRRLAQFGRGSTPSNDW